METYANLGGDSAVVGFEMTEQSISVQFRSGSIYLYNYEVTGSHYVEEMKRLAAAGRGLGRFIASVVKKNYASRLQ